ncbi:MAG TPA: hypothetical protein VFA04_24925, partial [Bryobacteraceae bacterium]|nr:hypothetical protein [Bryobacteraceae bacterium]
MRLYWIRFSLHAVSEPNERDILQAVEQALRLSPDERVAFLTRFLRSDATACAEAQSLVELESRVRIL